MNWKDSPQEVKDFDREHQSEIIGWTTYFNWELHEKCIEFRMADKRTVRFDWWQFEGEFL